MKDKPIKLWLSIVGAGFLFFFDILFAVPGFGLMTATLMALISWISALISLRSSKQRAGKLAVKGMIYLTAVGLIFAVFRLNIWVANANSQIMITALRAYNAEHGKYPEKLEELTPQFLDTIPPSAYRLTANKFRYTYQKGTHRLMWTRLPPYGINIYHLETDRLEGLNRD